MRKSAVLFLFTIIFVPLFLVADMGKVKIFTESYPPYNFKEGATLKGISVDILDLVLKQMKSKMTKGQISLVPWARGYRTVLENPSHMLFSTTRTAEREKLFKWVGPIIPTTVSVFARKSSGIKISGPADLKKYRIGAVKDDVGEQLLKVAGVPSSKIQTVPTLKSNVKKLAGKRIDLLAYEENVARWVMNKEKFSDYSVVHVLKRAELYFAFNPKTPDKVVKDFQKALDQVKSSPEYQKIIKKYLK